MMVDSSLSGIIDFQPVLLDLDGFSCLLPAAYFIASGELPCGERKMGLVTAHTGSITRLLF